MRTVVVMFGSSENSEKSCTEPPFPFDAVPRAKRVRDTVVSAPPAK